MDDFNDGEMFGFWEGLNMRAYAADFETTTDPDDCRVWAFACCQVGNPDFMVYGKDVSEFVGWCEQAANCEVYFHNLAFDGSFLFDHLLNSGWRCLRDGEKPSDMTFSALIGEQNQVYCIEMYFTPARKVKLMDSLKVIPLSVEAMARAYGLDEGKGELDYAAYRAPGHELTDEERDYIRRDVQIAAKVLHLHHQQGLRRMTAGSNALSDYKSMKGGNRGFRKVFPELTPEEDAFMRKAYRGGFTYVAPRYQHRTIGQGMVFDVNSLYPSVMYSRELPVGKPRWFDGDPGGAFYPTWIALGNFDFHLKPDRIPSLQLKNNPVFRSTEYVSDGERQWITLTNVDYRLMCEQYEVTVNEWFGGYCFNTSACEFRQYIDKWVEVKNRATVEGNGGMRQIAKLMLNSLYGKFATRTTCRGKHPELDDDGVVRYVLDEPSERKGVYLPVGVFVTSYARYQTISSAQKVYDRFVYADTDSLHLLGTDAPECLDVDPVRLGAWKHECDFDAARFLHAKCYAEHEVGADRLTVHVAGMPARCHQGVTLENFEVGACYPGKLYTKRVPGGIVLVEGDMQIRAT